MQIILNMAINCNRYLKKIKVFFAETLIRQASEPLFDALLPDVLTSRPTAILTRGR